MTRPLLPSQLQAATATPLPRRLDSLTGLRFLAAFLVFGYHMYPSLPAALLPAGNLLFGRGLAGVSFFFILSGFVLTWSHTDGVSPGVFYRRRFARIAPAYWVALLYSVALHLVGHAGRDVVVRAVPSVFFVQAWFPDPGIYFGGAGVEWSLSVEAIFYLSFPAIILLRRRRKALIAVATLSIVVLVAVPVLLHPANMNSVGFWAVYVLPLQRLPEFVGGMFLAMAMKNGWRVPVNAAGASALAVAAYLATVLVPLWGQVALVTFFPFLLLIAAAAQSDFQMTRPSLLRAHWLIRLGEWSFAFYLVHQVTSHAVQGEIEQRLPTVAPFITFPVAFAASLVVTVALYYGIEKPLEKRLRPGRPRPEMVAAAP